MMLKMVVLAFELPGIQPRVWMPCNFLGRCHRLVTLGGKGLMCQARGQVTPSPPAPPWPLGSPDARLIQLVGQLRPQPAHAASCGETAASSYRLEEAEPVASWAMSRQGGPQADRVQGGSLWPSPCL